MAAVLWLTMSLLVVHVAHSYILLTANMDDVQAIAKQMLSSPMVNQMGKMWRRAAMQFNRRLHRPITQRRAEVDLDSDDSNSSSGFSDDYRSNNRRAQSDISALSQNATGYLTSLWSVFSDFIKE